MAEVNVENMEENAETLRRENGIPSQLPQV